MDFDGLTHDAVAEKYLLDQVGADHPCNMTPLDVPAAVEGIPGLDAEQKAGICECTARVPLGEQ